MVLHLHARQETALTVAETLCPCVHHAVFSMEVRTRPIPLCPGPHRLCQAKPSPGDYVRYSAVRSRCGTVFSAYAVPCGPSVARPAGAVHDEWLWLWQREGHSPEGYEGTAVPNGR